MNEGHGNDISIDAPELMTRPERTRDAVATALLWAVYVYLWVPLVSLFAWWLGFEFAYDVMVRAGGASSLKNVLVDYSIAVGIIFAVVTLWSFSNRIRFRGLNRRKISAAVSDEELADQFGIDAAQVAHLRQQKIVAIDFDDKGGLRLPEVKEV
jgi:biofilm PGA synthesis protein PgaD